MSGTALEISIGEAKNDANAGSDCQGQMVSGKTTFQTVPLLLCEDYSDSHEVSTTDRGDLGKGVEFERENEEGADADDDCLAHLPVCQSFWTRRHSSLSSSRSSNDKYLLGSMEEELNLLHFDSALLVHDFRVILLLHGRGRF